MAKKKNKRKKWYYMVDYPASDKQIKYINDLCKDNGYEFYNQDIDMQRAGAIISFLVNDTTEPQYLFDYLRYE